MWLNNFDDAFLKTCYLKAVYVKFQQFSGSKTLFSTCMKLLPERGCHLWEVYAVLVWSVLTCQKRFALDGPYFLGRKAHWSYRPQHFLFFGVYYSEVKSPLKILWCIMFQVHSQLHSIWEFCLRVWVRSDGNERMISRWPWSRPKFTLFSSGILVTSPAFGACEILTEL